MVICTLGNYEPEEGKAHEYTEWHLYEQVGNTTDEGSDIEIAQSINPPEKVWPNTKYSISFNNILDPAKVYYMTARACLTNEGVKVFTKAELDYVVIEDTVTPTLQYSAPALVSVPKIMGPIEYVPITLFDIVTTPYRASSPSIHGKTIYIITDMDDNHIWQRTVTELNDITDVDTRVVCTVDNILLIVNRTYKLRIAYMATSGEVSPMVTRLITTKNNILLRQTDDTPTLIPATGMLEYKFKDTEIEDTTKIVVELYMYTDDVIQTSKYVIIADDTDTTDADATNNGYYEVKDKAININIERILKTYTGTDKLRFGYMAITAKSDNPEVDNIPYVFPIEIKY